MTDSEKIEILVFALNEINKTVYANTIIVGSPDYFKVRQIAVNAIKAVGAEVE